MRNKQYLAAIRPLDGALAMSTMRFADEVVPAVDIDGLPVGRAKPDAKELKLADADHRLARRRLEARAVPRHLHRGAADAHRSARTPGKEIVESRSREPTAPRCVDLMAALEASVDAAKGGGRGKSRRATTRKRSAKAS